MFFDAVLEVYKKRDAFIGRNFVVEMFPRGDNLAMYHQKWNEVAQKSGDNAFLKKQVAKYMDEIERKKKCYKACTPDILKHCFNIYL